MTSPQPPTWSFLTNHARVLLCIAQDPSIRLREVGERVGITERAAHRIVDELVDAGYISRTRAGRRNRYAIRDRAAKKLTVSLRARPGASCHLDGVLPTVSSRGR